ncbi:MAG TPA: D-alanyl-D-alanine carboxypeptidase, partial [Blastocatellia bacterium]
MSIRRLAPVILAALVIFESCPIDNAKPHSASSRNGRASARSRSDSRYARASSRGRNGREPRESRYARGGREARDTRGGRYSKYESRYGRAPRYARAYARGGRERWRRTDVVASSASHVTGIHNFLTETWTKSKAEQPTGEVTVDDGSVPLLKADRANTEVVSSGSVGAGAAEGSPGPIYPIPASARSIPVAGNVAGFGAPGAAATVPIVINPLVSAYAESLAERGFSASDQGFIVETADGRVVAENNADRAFNPASVTKVATSLVAISKLGPDYHFRTTLYTDGVLDPATGVLHGSLYVMGGGDPAFVTENALLIADQLNHHGIHIIDGNLVVQGQFYFNFSASREASAKAFRSAMTPDPETFGQSSLYMRFVEMKAAETAESG